MTTATLLRAEIDAVLADWAYYLDHGRLDELAGLFTEDALLVTGAVELRGRAKIKNRYLERTVVRSTRHIYSGLRVSATWCADERWRISERRIIPVFRDLARAPITT